MAKYQFVVTVSSDMHGYMAWAKETRQRLRDFNSAYHNSPRDAALEVEARIFEATYGDVHFIRRWRDRRLETSAARSCPEWRGDDLERTERHFQHVRESTSAHT